MKFKNTLLVFFLMALSTFSVAQTEMLTLPPQVASFCGATRGYWFEIPQDMTLTEVRVPTTINAGPQSIAVVTFTGNINPPSFPGTTLAYNTEFYVSGDPSLTAIPVSIPLTAGQIVGIYGSRGGCNSYGPNGPFNTTLFGDPVTLTRSGMQTNIQFTFPFPIWQEPNFNVSRVEATFSLGGGGGGANCVPNDCVTVTCPPDATVACIDEVDLDPTLATASSICGAIVGQWVTNPDISGVPGCPGTTYTYVYKAVDDAGNVGCCERVITIDNTPPTLTVPPGGNVNCPDEISVDISDATVGNACADYNLYITAPEVNGAVGCPGTTYTYTYRLVEACGRTVEAPRVFTETGAPLMITSTPPQNVTCSCFAGINPQPDLIEAEAGCGVGYTVTASEPVQVGGGIMDCSGTSYQITYTVTDDCNRSVNFVQTFTLQNDGPSFVNCPQNNWVQLNCEDYGGEAGTIAVLQAWIAQVEAYNSCGTQLTVNNNFNPNNINTCINNGINVVTFSTVDQCGRTAQCQATYVVVDTEAPIITQEAQDVYTVCSFNAQANLDAFVQNRGGAMADDGCSGSNLTWVASPANPQIPGNCGAVEVTFIVTDNCGNKTSTTASFNILDPMAPNFVVQPQDMTVDCGPNTNAAFNDWLASNGGAMATDMCGSVTITTDPANPELSDDCGNTGSVTVVFIADDGCGNTTESNPATFAVVDNTLPVLTCPDTSFVDEAPYADLAEFLAAGGQASDECELDEMSFALDSETSDGMICPETITRTYSIADACGNIATCEHISVINNDTVPPVFTFVPDDLTFFCDNGDTVDDIPDATATDNVDPNVEITFEDEFNTNPDDCGNGFGYDVTRTWTATDDCGNSTSVVAFYWFKGPFSFGNGGGNGLNNGSVSETAQADLENYFKVMPNPASENLNVTYGSSEDQRATIRIFNIVGKQVLQQIDFAAKGVNTTDFSVGHFTPGTYLISIEFGNQVITKKFIKS